MPSCSIRPRAEDRDPVAHDERLFLIVGDVQDGRPELAADMHDLELEGLAELPVQRSERLVHEQETRLEHDGARQRDPLLLAAGKLPRIPIAEAIELDQARARRRRARRISCRDRAAHLRAGRPTFWAAVMCGNSA